MLVEGSLRLAVDKTYRLDDALQAFERMARNEHFGKIVRSDARGPVVTQTIA